MNIYKKIGFKPADILLPENIDMTKWSVVACDQYTSQPEYWESVKNFVDENPSTLNMVFPELYLSNDNSQRIEKINNAMTACIESGILKEYKNAFIYCVRELGEGKIRKGIIGAVDLECYDYTPTSDKLIRATEGTVIERIPPRVQIRKDAPLELPHIMLLIDDAKQNIIENINTENLTMLYDFDLMENSGHIKGFLIDNNEIICEKLEKLLDNQGEKPLLFAVGDGNHSLATAKTCWENLKDSLSEEEKENHPARYALVEIVNIHDSSMIFEPIHRIVFNAGNIIEEFLKAEPSSFIGEGKGQQIKVVYNGKIETITIENPSHTLEVGTLQKFLDKYVKENNATVDYIHGDDVVVSLAKKEDTVGFILPGMDKSDLFTAIKNDGVLPRKTFSIGEAFEKRFYLECRKIK
ncbi:MAG: DUF1015 domain-containing protein [Clostridia bacterium]|nr:DUF1015 domain-containing protein [Clostridia bacterium]